MGFPTEGDLYGNGVPIGVVRVTALKARTRRSLRGAKGHRWSAFNSYAVRVMQRARVAMNVTCCL